MQSIPDFQQTTLPVFVPLMVPKSQHFDAFVCEESFACFISFDLFRDTVLKAVEFHRQPGLRAEHIQKIDAGGMLASKFEAGELAAPQLAPELFFFLRLFVTKPAGVRVGFMIQSGGTDLLPLLPKRRRGAG